MSTRTRLSFDVKINDRGQKITIEISDPGNLQADNLPLSTWGSAEILANALHHIDGSAIISDLSDAEIPVLELGAGTGIAGLSAAAIWRTNVVLTDLAPILPGIAANVDLNQSLLAQHGGSAMCGSLDWAHPDLLEITHDGTVKGGDTSVEPKRHIPSYRQARARIMLAADTIYSEEHPDLLCNAIKSRLHNVANSRFIMCYPLRVGYLDFIRDLWEKLEGIGLECIREGRETIDESWDEDTPYEWCVWRWNNSG